jgi:hypothetical protein
MTIDTCPKKDYLEIQKEILELASEVLSKEEIGLSEKISNDLISSKGKKEKARITLRRLVGVKPSRPLFYANLELKSLPRYTRNPIRYLGDYLDHLIKFWASEINGNEFLKKSLGINLQRMKGKIDEKLRLNLINYNNFCYVPAKHDFNVIERKRRFTCKEAVYIIFITMALSKIIISKSEKARQYSNSEINDDWALMKYSSENKDVLVEEEF